MADKMEEEEEEEERRELKEKMGDKMEEEEEEEEREEERRRRIVYSLQDLMNDMAEKMNFKTVKRVRNGLEEVVEAEEARYGRRGGLEKSAINEVSRVIFLALNLQIMFPKGRPLEEEEMVACVSLVLRRTIITTFAQFNNVHELLVTMLSDTPFGPASKLLSEEMRMHLLTGLAEVFRTPVASVRGEVLGRNFRGKLGHTVYVGLAAAKNETSKALRLQAIHTVQAVGWKDIYHSLSKREKDELSATFVNFLPGIVQAMTKVAMGSDTQGSKIIAAAVDTWTYFVTLVMRESYLSTCIPYLGESTMLVSLRRQLEGGGGGEVNDEDEEEEEEAKERSYDDDGRPNLPNTKVTRKWVRETESKIGILAGVISALATHQHWLVRRAMAQWAAAVVTECVRSLPSCLGPALEVLLTLQQDDMEEVAEEAVGAMRRLREALTGGGGGGGGGDRQKLEELLKKKIMSLAIRLPSIVRQEDDAKTLGAVRQVEGCLEVLGGQGVQALLSSSHAHRLLHSLSLLLSLDTTDSHLLRQRSPAVDPFEAPPLKPHMGRSFTHFRDKRILQVVSGACGLLGRHGRLVRVVHLCVEMLHSQITAHLYSETLLMLGLVLDGVPRGETDAEIEETQHIVQLILDEVLSPEVLGSPLPCTPEEENTLASLLTPLPTPSPSLPAVSARVQVVRVVQGLGVVGACARLMGGHFTQFLSSVLCPIMEFAGVANLPVSLAATSALQRMSEASDCADIGEFIQQSAPHLWFPLSMRLKRLSKYPASAIVLRVALRYAGTQMHAFTEELVEEAVTTLDLHHVQAADPMLRVLLAYVSVIAAEEDEKSESASRDSEKGDCSPEIKGDASKGDFKGHDSAMWSEEEVEKGKLEEEKSEKIVELKRKKESKKDRKKKGKGSKGHMRKEEKEEEEREVKGIKMKDVGRKEENKEDNKKEEEIMKIKEENNGAITKFLQEYHEAKISVKRGLEEEEEEEERLAEEEGRKNWEAEKTTPSHDPFSTPPSPSHAPSPPPEPDEPTPPRNIELVKDVVERCAYLLHMGGREGRLLTLEVARWGCRALRNWKNLLLPCTHKLWRPIVLLLSQPDPVVGTRTLALVAELVALSGDFLRRRVLQKALPLVLNFLESQASVSLGAKECHTPALKAQRSCLGTLLTLLPDLELGVKEAGSVVGVLGAYLDLRHPPDLFRGAMGLLRVLARSHPHHVWLELAQRRPPSQLVHPSPLLPAVKIGSSRHQGSLPTEAEELFQELS